MHFVSPFFLDTLKKSKKMNLKSNVMNSLKSRSTFQISVSKGWRVLAGWLRTGLLNATVKGIETPQEMQRWAAFFLFPKIPNEVNFNGFLFRVSRRFWWRHATHQNTPKDHQNEKRKTKTTSLSKLSHLQPHQDFPHFPLQYHRPTFPQPVSRCGRGCTFPYPF